MLARLRFITLAVLTAVGLAVDAVALRQSSRALTPLRGAGTEWSVVEAAPSSLAMALRAAERVEIVSLTERTVASGPAAETPAGGHTPDAITRRTPGVTGWCDLTQCRRQAGAQLLGYATPPPRAG